jgi:hypothetical protein
LLRRSHGAAETPEMDNFWSALGDTTQTVSNIGAIFDRYPIPSTLEAKLLESTSDPKEGAREPLRLWIKGNPKAVKEMETVMENTINKSKSRSSWFRYRWPSW